MHKHTHKYTYAHIHPPTHTYTSSHKNYSTSSFISYLLQPLGNNHVGAPLGRVLADSSVNVFVFNYFKVLDLFNPSILPKW